MGANNVREYLPCHDTSCIIEVQDFPNPSDLADLLLRISRNDELFEAFHLWRAFPLRQNFVELTKLTRHNFHCAVCLRVVEIVTKYVLLLISRRMQAAFLHVLRGKTLIGV